MLTLTPTTEERYQTIAPLINSICRKWENHKGFDYQELRSIANEVYMTALLSYDPARSKFSTWLTNKIRFRFLEESRTRWRKAQRHEAVGNIEKLPQGRVWSPETFLAELSADGQYMVHIAFGIIAANYPPDTTIKVRFIRKEIKRILKEMGWKKFRLNKTFAEIRKELR